MDLRAVPGGSQERVVRVNGTILCDCVIPRYGVVLSGRHGSDCGAGCLPHVQSYRGGGGGGGGGRTVK